MSTAYVTELTALATHITTTQIAQMPPVAEQKITFTTTTQSAAFNSATRFIRVHPTSICSIAIGSSPTATTSTMRMAADQVEYFGVTAGDKIAFVDNT
jgi:hypothetical protein